MDNQLYEILPHLYKSVAADYFCAKDSTLWSVISLAASCVLSLCSVYGAIQVTVSHWVKLTRTCRVTWLLPQYHAATNWLLVLLGKSIVWVSQMGQTRHINIFSVYQHYGTTLIFGLLHLFPQCSECWTRQPDGKCLSPLEMASIAYSSGIGSYLTEHLFSKVKSQVGKQISNSAFRFIIIPLGFICQFFEGTMLHLVVLPVKQQNQL